MANPSETAEVGTKKTGFAKGAVWGPFQCAACRHFTKSEGKTVCVHPEVNADKAPELQERDSRGRPFVEAEDCCRYEHRAKESKGAAGPTIAERSGMRG